MKTKTKAKAGGWINHNAAKPKKGVRVKTAMKAGGLSLNHNARKAGVKIRTAVKGGLLLPAVQAARQANHNARKARR